MSGEFSQMQLVRKVIASRLMMLLWRKPPSAGSNWTLGHRVVAGCIGGVWMHAEHHGAVVIGRSSKGKGTWCLTAMFVLRGALPGMLLHVHLECVRFVNCSARLVVGLGANMMGGASVSVGGCGGMLFAGSPSSSITLYLGTLCLGTLCSWEGYMAPIADLLVGGSICAQVWDRGFVLRTMSL
jgi:hypothetical protein